MYNYASSEGNYEGYDKETRDTSSWKEVRKDEPKVRINKTRRNSKATYLINDTVDYNVQIRLEQSAANRGLENPKVVDLLPVGQEYVANSSYLRQTSNTVVNEKGEVVRSRAAEPQIIYNFKDTGRTALIWDLGEALMTTIRANPNTILMNIEYSTRITRLTDAKNTINYAYLSWSNNDKVVSGWQWSNVEDSWDLNENGRTDDIILRESASFNYVPPREKVVSKSVKGSLNGNFTLPPGEGLSEIGTHVDFEFTLFNNSVNDVTQMHIVDLIPTVGDRTVAIDESVTPNVRVNRNSTFGVTLSGPLTPPTGFDVFYTTDVPGEDMVAFTNNANWTTSASDYSKVTAFKLVLQSGNIFRSEEVREFTVNFNIPNNYDLKAEKDVAVNSFGFSTGSTIRFTESNMAKVRIVKYEVDGYVFEDMNNDNLMNDGDKIFEGHKVVLVDKDGNVVLDPEGNPYETVTDVNGYYHMNVYRQGDYRIRIEKPANYDGVEPSTPDITNGSHVLDPNQGYTDEFTLNPSNLKESRNGGFFQVTTDVTVNKVWVGGSAIRPTVEVQLYQNGAAYEAPVTLNGTESTPWTHTWTGVPVKDANGVAYIYTVDEVNVPDNYEKTVDGNTITNTYVSPKTEVTVNKIWVSGIADARPTIEVQLYRNGVVFGNPVALENGTTSYTWTDLDETDEQGVAYVYTVDEVNVPENYEKTVDGNTITNTYVSPKTEVTVKKIWVGGLQERPTIEVQLYRNGEVFGTPVSLENGTTTYTFIFKFDNMLVSGYIYLYRELFRRNRNINHWL